MCKFRDENSPGWNVLAGCLYDFVKQAPSAIERTWAQEQRRNLQATHDFVANMIHSKWKSSSSSIAAVLTRIQTPRDGCRPPILHPIPGHHPLAALEGSQKEVMLFCRMRYLSLALIFTSRGTGPTVCSPVYRPFFFMKRSNVPDPQFMYAD